MVYFKRKIVSIAVSLAGIITNNRQGNVARQSYYRWYLVLIGCIICIIASACDVLTSQGTSPSTNTTPVATVISWGTQVGDTISLHKQLTCGLGCPEPLHVRIDVIQIDKVNMVMTWNVHFFAPMNTATDGIKDASFPTFTLRSNTTSLTQAMITMGSSGNMQAKFPFTPVANELYTLTVIANYYTVAGNIESVDPETLSYEAITLSFQS